jgi:hypothetical protein
MGRNEDLEHRRHRRRRRLEDGEDFNEAIRGMSPNNELVKPTNLKQHITRYILVGVIVILSLAVGFIAGRESAVQDARFAGGIAGPKGGNMISEQEAIERAKEWLIQSKKSIKDRPVTVSLTGAYKVVFSPPEGTLGGDFTLTVDANTGEILTIVIER